MEIPRDNVSLFLTLWMALDDVFPDGMLLSSLLESSGQSSFASPNLPPSPHSSSSSSGSSNNKNNKNASKGAERPPALASESQQVHLALCSVLDRGVKEAERRLDVLPFLHRYSPRSGEEENGNNSNRRIGDILRQFTAVKNCIIATSNRRMHSIPALHQSGWVVIGILLVDTAVRHSLHLEGGDGSMEERQSVAVLKDLWDQKVDSSILRALGNASQMLRAGDLNSLRTYFR